VRKAPLVLAATAIAAAAAAPAAGSGKSVKVVDYKFVAKTIHISRGTTVTWKFLGSDPHNVTFSGFHSKTMSSGSFKHKFRKAGTYKYHCTIHGKSFGMHGTVVVS